ncbi:glycosyltransferase family 4 protein [Alcanivorax sp. 1008]|uniref:glycosyltransferase family 4 protein n=1 Tax=Alcanivorax sp. 1008 TaxID=2816853 RepID=UPI001D1F7E86|nr:glycosyltransferase family 4 protein [Alcanivorax sp. 1008]MCC1498237.1 glycosyltransferase family 4 protein [Alcanivorax sp. 1008]
MPINSVKNKRTSGRILHIASWYPNPWDGIEGNFVRDQIRVFKRDLDAETIVIQVRSSGSRLPRFRIVGLDDEARGYFLLAAVKPGKVMEWLSSIFLIIVLVKERAWRFNALHFHIAYPLLLHSRLWRWIFKRPILISEHWSAYHYNFYLPQSSKSLLVLRKPFQQGDAVLAVSQALLEDVCRFSCCDNFPKFVIPNFVPLHGVSASRRVVPTFFVVNRWQSIKNPMPMLEGLEMAARLGAEFKLVIGGYGELIDQMTSFVQGSSLNDRTTFVGKMTKPQIADQLASSDGYLFSSDYETFSIACAEALGAGVPLIGPYIPAISEYASHLDWVKVKSRDAESWSAAIATFLDRRNAGEFSADSIASRAEQHFSEDVIRRRYREAMTLLKIMP